MSYMPDTPSLPPVHMIKLTENRENAAQPGSARTRITKRPCRKLVCLRTAWSIAHASARDGSASIFDCAKPIDVDGHMSVAEARSPDPPRAEITVRNSCDSLPELP
jgi:hypothetical protein